jgi:DASH complex subunit ASK1
LSGVEERDEEEDEISYTQSHDNASTYATSASQPGEETLQADAEEHQSYDPADDSLLDNLDISGSTPRAPRPRSTDDKPKFADYPSPYEALKQELKGGAGADEGDDTQTQPTTPGAKSRLPDMSMTPISSPFDPTSYLQSTAQAKAGTDRLLHRVLDKNYRVHATPHTARKENKTPANKPSWRDTTSPMSSPPAAAPQLHADIFSSPIRQQYNRPSAPRTPGVSVNPTPAKGKGREIIPKLPKKDEISWESDSDEDAEGVYRELGMSPPKTIQFSLPQSRLLQTPGQFLLTPETLTINFRLQYFTTWGLGPPASQTLFNFMVLLTNDQCSKGGQ